MKNNSILQLIKQTKPSKLILAFALIMALVATAIGLVIPMLTRELIDGTLDNFTAGQVLLIVGIFVLQVITATFTFYAMGYLGNTIVAKIRERLWGKIIYLPIPFFSKTMSGETASRVVNDTNVLRDLVSQQAINVITGVINLVASIIILFIMDWQMTTIILVAVPLTALVVVPLGKLMYDISVKMQSKTADFTGKITQVLTEMKLVKSSNGEKEEIIRENKLIKDIAKYGLKEIKIFAMLMPAMQGIIMLVIFGVIIYGAMRVSTGTLTTGTLIAFVLYLFQIIMPIVGIGEFFTQVQKAKGATERIMEILEEPIEDLNKGIDVDLTGKNIYFKNIGFRYDEDSELLSDISFKAKPNETVAFVGPSGAGKSTIFALIERFYHLNSGAIMLDDINIEEISLKSWRSQIGYVPQESSLLSASIRENLCYGLEREVSDEELWEVVELACAREIIENLPEKFDSHIGERGMKLSGGERQRIAIARAFLRNPKILLLDEATASLDSQSEGVVQEALSNLMRGRTTFVIAHRLSTIVDAHQIVFIEDGQVTGIGTHEELTRDHELYSEFASQQLA